MAEQVDQKSANKSLFWTAVIVGFIVLALITNGFGLLGGNNSITGQTINENIPLQIGNSPVLGNPDAPVTIYEFSDFSCPFCGATAGQNQEVISNLQASNPGWTAPIPRVKEEFVESGQVKLVFKYFPSRGQGEAAHRVGFCLNEQSSDLFWEFHEAAFANQNQAGNTNAMRSIAEDLGADMDEINSCLRSGNYQSQFAQDRNMGLANGVSGTPAFFVNGEFLSGAQSYSAFEQTISRFL